MAKSDEVKERVQAFILHVQNTHAKREEVRGRKRRTQRWREGGREGDKDKEGNRNREREGR